MDNVMEMQDEFENMTERADRYQITVTLSKKTHDQLRVIADWKEIPMATLVRQIIEREQESPAFGNLYKRALSKE
ncbi:hypothetical protein BZZ01_04520 [Nostocales cyanobacterium HT-58-2]|nr:hypothetical protein BZZ01_04520 [Nostocales cyanobacterium HT-58-2]